MTLNVIARNPDRGIRPDRRAKNISYASLRKIVFDGLKAGGTYIFQLMAIGGSTGQTDWSEPASKMAL